MAAHAHRPLLARIQCLVALVLVMAMSGLSHAAQEMLEDAVHEAGTGHAAHADHHPEGEAEDGSEHDCYGAVHNCGCCPSTVAAPHGPVTLPLRRRATVGRAWLDDDFSLEGVRARIDRPPRS